MSAQSLNGRRAADPATASVSIITRCSDAVSRAIASRLARRGDRLVISGFDDSQSDLRAFRDEMTAKGAAFVATDAGPDGSRKLADAAIDRFGRIDVLVNGFNRGASGADEVARMIDAVVPHMRKGGGGQIVNLITAAGRYRSAYFGVEGDDGNAAGTAAADGAVFALTRQLGFELAREGIRVNAVSVGCVRGTSAANRYDAMGPRERAFVLEEISLGRLGEPDEVAGVVEFLASKASSYVTCNAIDVNGGWWMS